MFIWHKNAIEIRAWEEKKMLQKGNDSDTHSREHPHALWGKFPSGCEHKVCSRCFCWFLSIKKK